MLMLGMEVTCPIHVLFGSALRDVNSPDPVGYIKYLREILREIHALATSKLQSQMQYQKHTYDLWLQQKHYEVGDLVYHLNSVHRVGDSKKLDPVWVGPLIITEVLNPVLYQVWDCKHEHVLHHDQLEHCEDRTVHLWLCKMWHNFLDLDTTIANDESEQEAEVDRPVLLRADATGHHGQAPW